jgi:hypothetical protein
MAFFYGRTEEIQGHAQQVSEKLKQNTLDRHFQEFNDKAGCYFITAEKGRSSEG